VLRLTAAALALVIATPAAAQELPAEIAAGIAAYDDLEYEQAIALLRPALRKKLPRDAKLAGYRCLGLSLVALGRINEARDAFRLLLEIDGRYRLPESENPTARKLLQEVRLDLPAEVGLTHSASPTPGRADSPLAVSIDVRDESRVVSGVTVHYRVAGSRRYGTVGATALGADRYNATIPGTFVAPPAIEYYVVARGADGRRVAIAGSAAEPISIAVDRRADGGDGSLLSSPLFWLGTGAVVAAGAVAAVLLWRPSDDGPAETGTVQVNVVW
jgi:tetratricopeptide (TPR) repeat protein